MDNLQKVLKGERPGPARPGAGGAEPGGPGLGPDREAQLRDKPGE